MKNHNIEVPLNYDILNGNKKCFGVLLDYISHHWEKFQALKGSLRILPWRGGLRCKYKKKIKIKIKILLLLFKCQFDVALTWH